MKKLLPFFLLVCLHSGVAQAQAWFQSDYRWIFHVSGGFAGFDFDFEIYADADTLIQGKACRKWVTHSNDTHSYTLRPVFSYADGPRAYYYEESLDSFLKIYDFSLPVGAKVQIPKDFGVFTYQIDSIDQVQAGDFLLKRQRVHYLQPDGQPSTWHFDILENIGMVGLPFDPGIQGCSFVFIPDLECGSVVDGVDMTFNCFSSASGSFHPFSGACMLTSVHVPETVRFTLIPNPAAGYFTVWSDIPDNAIQSVELQDICGRLLQTWNGAEASYSLSGVPQGMYLVKLKLENGACGVKKLVRE